MRWRPFVAATGVLFLVLAALAVVQPGSRATARATRAAQAFPTAAKGPISAALGRLLPGYDVDGDTADNPAQRLSVRFTPAGASLSGADGARTQLSLRAYQQAGGRSVPVSAVAPTVAGNRAAYDHGDLAEWWANGPLGLEQGFDVDARPAGAGSTLTLSIAVGGDARPALDRDSVELGALRYGALRASDANGRTLPARLAVNGDRIEIEVDDRGATFPVAIDPLVQQAELTNAGGAAGDEFGDSVAADANTIVVGAYGNGGAAYVFSEPPGGWGDSGSPTAVLSAGSSGQGFGYSVAIDSGGDTIVVGAPGSGGAAYVFDRPAGGVWKSTSTPTATLGGTIGSTSLIGASVAIDSGGDTIAVGAPQHDRTITDQGVALVYDRPLAGWGTGTQPQDQTAELVASTPVSGAYLGLSVAIAPAGTEVIAGAPGDCSGSCPGSYAGAAYVFTSPTQWAGSGGDDVFSAIELTPSDGKPTDEFGWSVAIGGAVVAIGSRNHGVAAISGATNTSQGAVYLFVQPADGTWASADQNAELTALAGSANDVLGESVAVTANGQTVFGGAPQLAQTGAGTVYEFSEPAGGWPATTAVLPLHEHAALVPAGAPAGAGFGAAVALAGSGLVVGAPIQQIGTNQMQGAAYAFGLPTPTVSIASPANGASYTQGTVVHASYGCSVSGSTISSCTGPVPDGGSVATGTLGSHSFTVTATTADGVSASKAVTYHVVALAISHLSQSHSRWREGKALARISVARKPPVGTVFSFTLNGAATVTLSFSYAADGRKVHGRCRVATSANRHDRKCVRAAGSMTLKAAAGKRKVSFDGRISKRSTLAPGRYTVTLSATNAGGKRSNSHSLTFTVLKGS
jgi:trimeric autotransporter adhesin